MTTQELSLPKDQNLPTTSTVKHLPEIKLELLESHIRFVLLNVNTSFRVKALEYINNEGVQSFISLLFGVKFNPIEFSGNTDNSEMSIRSLKGNITEAINTLHSLNVDEYESPDNRNLGPRLKRSIPVDFGSIVVKPINELQQKHIKNHIAFLFAQLSTRTYAGTYSKYATKTLAKFIKLIYHPEFTLYWDGNLGSKSEFEFEGFRRELLVYLRKLKVVS